MLTDDEFLARFFGLTFGTDEFHHRDHLRLAWLAVRRHGPIAAEAVVSDGLRRFADHHGRASRYHETMTRFWVRLVAHCIESRPDLQDFDAFMAAFPMLSEPALFEKHWSREAMFAAGARAAWREPDLVPLPF